MSELSGFIKEALERGQPRAQIREVLAKAQWPSDEVEDALSRYADVDFPVAVPMPKQSGAARDAFLYLVTFTALYITATALGSLLFGLVDHFFPDPARDPKRFGDPAEGLRWAISSLVVAAPIYFGLMRMHLRDYVRNAERRTSLVRRWLTYLTLFVAAVVGISTLIITIGQVLGGELAARFVLKTAVVLVLSGGVFLYYSADMRDRKSVRTA